MSYCNLWGLAVVQPLAKLPLDGAAVRPGCRSLWRCSVLFRLPMLGRNIHNLQALCRLVPQVLEPAWPAVPSRPGGGTGTFGGHRRRCAWADHCCVFGLHTLATACWFVARSCCSRRAAAAHAPSKDNRLAEPRPASCPACRRAAAVCAGGRDQGLWAEHEQVCAHATRCASNQRIDFPCKHTGLAGACEAVRWNVTRLCSRRRVR